MAPDPTVDCPFGAVAIVNRPACSIILIINLLHTKEKSSAFFPGLDLLFLEADFFLLGY